MSSCSLSGKVAAQSIYKNEGLLIIQIVRSRHKCNLWIKSGGFMPCCTMFSVGLGIRVLHKTVELL
jgi:hypothetical protein